MGGGGGCAVVVGRAVEGASHTSEAKLPAGFVATDRSAGSTKAARAQRRGRAGAGCGSAALIPPKAGNGGTVIHSRAGASAVCVLERRYTTSMTSIFSIL